MKINESEKSYFVREALDLSENKNLHFEDFYDGGSNHHHKWCFQGKQHDHVLARYSHLIGGAYMAFPIDDTYSVIIGIDLDENLAVESAWFCGVVIV